MAYYIYTSNGALLERADDATRKVYDGYGAVIRDYSPEENEVINTRLAKEQQVWVQEQLKTDTIADLDKLTTVIADLQILLGDNSTEGSIRTARAAIGNTYSRDAIRALADLLITDAQATRRIARQTLRLAKTMVGDYTSADVGAE